MSDIAIKVEGLSKRYKIGAYQEPYKSLRDVITNAFTAPFRGMKRKSKGGKLGENLSALGHSPSSSLDGYIWALKDISLEIRYGAVLGIIGANGAGKSTLLKILSRITEPTEGRAEINGRLGSLLEVGTGFHPELTGRENIYLNGAILGMKKGEIDKRFDEIVAFSEIEKFIDTPVKRYSSGMYVRLAFAVAAHLELEILLVDEVLAVGDAAFQKKCLGRMGDVVREGRTILFVSHNMSAILRLCSSAILLRKSQLAFSGSPRNVIDHYLLSIDYGTDGTRTWGVEESTHKSFRPIAARIQQYGKATGKIMSARPFSIEFEYELIDSVAHLLIQLEILNADGVSILTTQDRDDPDQESQANFKRKPGRYLTICDLPEKFFNEGTFIVSINVTSRPKVGHFFYAGHALKFKVDITEGVGSHLDTKPPSLLRPAFHWRTSFMDET